MDLTCVPPEPFFTAVLRPPEIPRDPMEFLSRSWSPSALEVSRALVAGAYRPPSPIAEDPAGESEECCPSALAPAAVTGNPFAFASSVTSQMVMERIMSQSQSEVVSPLTSGRLSHSSGPLNGGSHSDSPPVSPSEIDDAKLLGLGGRGSFNPPRPQSRTKTVGRWLKDRRVRRKEEARAHNAQLHAAVSVSGVAAAVAAVAAATASSNLATRTDAAVASAAALVAAQCVEAAESLGADRDHLASVVASAVSVRCPGDIITLTAAAATALRGAAALRARALKEVWNIAAVIPVEKSSSSIQAHVNPHHHQVQQEIKISSSNSGELELIHQDNLHGLCSQELLARGTELLKRTRKGALHWKLVSVYINRMGLVMLKMKSKHIAGAITKKKKSVVCEVCKNIVAWPGRPATPQRHYFGLKIAEQRVIEFECRSGQEYEMWTLGVAQLLAITSERKTSFT